MFYTQPFISFVSSDKELYIMKSINLILIFILSLFFSCNTSDDIGENNCEVENPVTDLNWLSSKIADLEATETTTSKYNYVSQADYHNKTVFIFGNCCPACNSVSAVYDCEGTVMGIIGYRDQDIDYSILNEDTIIWSPSDFECSE